MIQLFVLPIQETEIAVDNSAGDMDAEVNRKEMEGIASVMLSMLTNSPEKKNEIISGTNICSMLTP